MIIIEFIKLKCFEINNYRLLFVFQVFIHNKRLLDKTFVSELYVSKESSFSSLSHFKAAELY